MYNVENSSGDLSDICIPQNLTDWIKLLNTEIVKKRDILSCDPLELKKVLKLAIQFNVIGVSIPAIEGGINLDCEQQHYYYKILAKISGTFAFFSTQFSTALSIISAGNNAQLKDNILKKDNFSDARIGLATAHLKNFKNPSVTGEENEKEYVINGTLRYVSGYRIFNKLILGFVCQEYEIFALIPFKESQSFQIQSSPKFITANSTNTVNCILINHRIKKNMIISKVPISSVCKTIGKSTRHLVSFQIGLAYSALELIKSSPYLTIDAVSDTYNYLTLQLLALDNKMAILSPEASAVPIRIEVYAFLSELFLLGDQIFKGSGTIENHPYVLIKHESQVIGATASSEETLLEMCKHIMHCH